MSSPNRSDGDANRPSSESNLLDLPGGGTIARLDTRKLYRVRHPAAPDLFVWLAGTENGDGSFTTPVKRHKSVLGEVAKLTISFRQTHPGYNAERADELARLVGGSVEEVPDLG